MGRSVVLAYAVALAVLGPLVGSAPASATSDGAAPLAPVPTIFGIVANVSLERLYADLYALQNFTTRYAFSPNIVAASQFIFDRFAANPALVVSFQDFVYGGTAMRNVVAVLPGLDPTNRTVYVVGGHYDSTSADSNPMVLAPGADDNGSGTVAALEAARVLSRYRFNATLVFVAFTAEEQGLVGSDFHTRCLVGNRADVGLYVNMDMVGYDPMDGNGIDVITNVPSRWAADLFETAASDYAIGLVTTQVLSLAANSDHASFWAKGYPAIFLSESDFNFPNYHSSTDTVAAVNMNLVANTTQGSVATLATLAGALAPGTGALFLDRTSYGTTGAPVLLLYDANRNANPAVRETAVVAITSAAEPVGEALTLTETGPDTGMFAGTASLGTAPGVPGELQVVAGDTVTARYQDADPPVTVTDTAAIDGAFPRIANVAAAPGITTAAILWETDEPTDATVVYGPTPALGASASDPRLLARHRVDLENLQPDTTYYFEVRSTDAAGQAVAANNGGAPFAFHTLTGILARPLQARVGYVRSSDATGNQFGSNSMLAGYSAMTGRTYRGAAQFDTTGTPLPPGATVTDAWIDLFGQEWVYTAPGQWQVQYLNGSIDPGWVGETYATLTAAPVDFPIPPTMTNADLVPGKWQTVRVPALRLAEVRDRVNGGNLSIRIDGPTGPQGSIFDWATGFPPGCPGLPSQVPRLSVLFSPAGDTVGPDVTARAASPNPTMTAAGTTLTAIVSDAATGDTPIAGVEFFLGADPGQGLGTPMAAVDGNFDAIAEDAAYALEVSGLPSGTYALGVRGRDRAGNWGPASTFLLYVGVWDLVPPSVSATDAPDPAPLGGIVTITANATDDVSVADVWLNVSRPDGTSAFNVTMPRTGADWVHATPYSVPGTWTYAVWAQDTSGKWGSAQGAFLVRAVAPPVIAASATPDPAEVPALVTIAATVTDDTGVAEVRAVVTQPDGAVVNATMARIGNAYTLERTYTALGTHAFVVWASDVDGAWASASGSFLVRDTTPPAIAADADPPSQVSGGPVRIRAQVQDNDRVAAVTVEVWDPDGTSLGGFPMTYDAVDGSYGYDLVADRPGRYTFNVTATDPSGNAASAAGTYASTAGAGVPLDARWPLLLLAVVAVVVLVLVWRRRKKREGPPPSGGAPK